MFRPHQCCSSVRNDRLANHMHMYVRACQQSFICFSFIFQYILFGGMCVCVQRVFSWYPHRHTHTQADIFICTCRGVGFDSTRIHCLTKVPCSLTPLTYLNHIYIPKQKSVPNYVFIHFIHFSSKTSWF